MSINNVMISGHVGGTPDIRQTASGMAVLGFSVAVNDRRKNNAGEWEDYPNWVDVTVFGKYAEAIAQRLDKGDKVAVSGKLHTSTWERDGEKRRKLEVIAQTVETMTARGEGGARVQQTAQEAPQDGVYDEDIPF